MFKPPGKRGVARLAVIRSFARLSYRALSWPLFSLLVLQKWDCVRPFVPACKALHPICASWTIASCCANKTFLVCTGSRPGVSAEHRRDLPASTTRNLQPRETAPLASISLHLFASSLLGLGLGLGLGGKFK